MDGWFRDPDQHNLAIPGFTCCIEICPHVEQTTVLGCDGSGDTRNSSSLLLTSDDSGGGPNEFLLSPPQRLLKLASVREVIAFIAVERWWGSGKRMSCYFKILPYLNFSIYLLMIINLESLVMPSV